MTRKSSDSLEGRRVVCPDGVKGEVVQEYPVPGSAHPSLRVRRDDGIQDVYPARAVTLIEPRTHTLPLSGDTRLAQLIAEFASLEAAAKRYDDLKKQIKEALPDATLPLGVAWEDGDSVEIHAPAAIVRAYPMTRSSIDVERMKREYPEGYHYFLRTTQTVALRRLTQ